ncbi:MAG: 2-oxo acid dehydrogenase subunit E2 [Candidatus Solibacter usitatus]|nr:2-oxo acid dehydrogenase subunit E2 [Candidatus Solibacter usitatus]
MIEVVMPQMGESIVEGTLTKWLKQAGDRVERDEPLFEISTDKVDSEIPAPAAGILAEVLVAEGSTVAINTVVGRINDGSAAAAPPPAPRKEDAKPVAAAPPPPPAPVAAPAPVVTEEVNGPLSPLVRRMAREYKIDLSQIRGTGAGGRISKADVEAYMAAQGARTVAASGVTMPAAPVESVAPLARTGPAKTRIEAMSTMRAKIAEHMVFSQRTSAHVTTVHKVDVTKVAKLRDRLKDQFQERYGFGLTFLPFFARAAAEALRTFPIVNASIEGNNIIYHNDVNIGIAVALDGGAGLIVPVIRNADEKNVVGLQRSIVDLAGRARSKQLKPDEVSGGTFSITNFGSFGSIFATPVINQPQVAILGTGSVEKTPVVVDDAIAIRSIAYIALTFDHRLIDGAMADQFCQKVKSILENWSDQVI